MNPFPIQDRLGRLRFGQFSFLVIPLIFLGCSAPAVRQQRLVSKPNMTFADSAVFTYNSPRLLPQIAPGFPGGDASQNSGCSSCR